MLRAGNATFMDTLDSCGLSLPLKYMKRSSTRENRNEPEGGRMGSCPPCAGKRRASQQKTVRLYPGRIAGGRGAHSGRTAIRSLPTYVSRKSKGVGFSMQPRSPVLPDRKAVNYASSWSAEFRPIASSSQQPQAQIRAALACSPPFAIPPQRHSLNWRVRCLTPNGMVSSRAWPKKLVSADRPPGPVAHVKDSHGACGGRLKVDRVVDLV